jgi:LacI family gluconate utilization system Gnt-I transcriptional repressor
MLSWRPSGAIIAGLEHTEAARAMLENAGIPIVEIMDSDGTPIDSVVGISHRAAGRQMADAIAAAGYKRIGFLGTKMADDHRAKKRLEGLTEGLAEHGLEVVDSELYSGGSALKKGREMTEAMLTRSPDVDFLCYSNDMIGAGGLLYCLEKGYDIPGALGMAGFNGVEFLDGLPIRLATIDACRREIGEQAANIIAGRGMDGVIGGHRIELSPRLDHGDTIRKA